MEEVPCTLHPPSLESLLITDPASVGLALASKTYSQHTEGDPHQTMALLE